MAKTPTYKKTAPAKPVDPKQLNNADFRWFITHFPAEHLRNKKIKRTSFVAVGLTLSLFGRYESGTKVNPSTKALHELTGAHEDTIAKVLSVLLELGAIEKVGLHQGANGGQPYPEFRFRRSDAVKLVLAKRDATDWDELRKPSSTEPSAQPEGANPTGESANPTGESANPTGESANPTGEDNKNSSNTMNRPLASAPVHLSPLEESRAKDKDEEKKKKSVDELISSSWSDDGLDQVLAEMDWTDEPVG